MILYEEKIKCSNCNSKHISNKFYNLCEDCNYKRTHDGKSRFEIYSERAYQKQKLKVFKPIKIKPVKTTGERDLFLIIWNERPHYCSQGSECVNSKNEHGVWLGNEPKTWMFSHIKPKSTHPELRLVKENIDLLCYECHYKRDFR